MGKSQVSRKHHYVPKAILKNFCFEGETVYYANRGNDKGIEKRNIDSIFRRNHFNSFEEIDGTKNDTLEKFFAHNLDNFIPGWRDVFETAASTGEVKFGNTESRNRFVQFFYNHTKRTPDFVEPIVEKVRDRTFSEKGLLELQDRLGPLTEEQFETFHDENFRNRALRNSRIENMSRQGLGILEKLAMMKIVVATPKKEQKVFMVASNPVVRFEKLRNQELGDDGVEMWTTLSPKIAVGFVATPNAPDRIFLTDENVRKLNLQLAKRSRAIASSSKKLLSSIGKAAW